MGGNTICENSFSIGFQYFNDSQRFAQTLGLDEYYGSDDDRHQLYWALMWWTLFAIVLIDGYISSGMNPFQFSETPVTNETVAVALLYVSNKGSVGILFCETNISEVVRCSRTNSQNSSDNVITDLFLQ